MPKAELVKREVVVRPKEQALAVVVRRMVDQIDETAAAVAEIRSWLAQEYERRAIEKAATEKLWEFMATLERPAQRGKRTKSKDQQDTERLELALAEDQLRQAYKKVVTP